MLFCSELICSSSGFVKNAFNSIFLVNFFMSSLKDWILNLLGVGQKLRFLLSSLYCGLVKLCLERFTTFPEGSVVNFRSVDPSAMRRRLR